MDIKRSRIVGVLALVVIVGVVVVLDPFQVNRVHIRVGLLEVSALSPGFFSTVRAEGNGKTATVHIDEQTARVTDNRVELAGGRFVPIPPACKRVELRESPGGIVVLVDGVQTR